VVGVMSVLSVGLGTALAELAERFPARIELFETIGGILLIGGFAAIGCALPSI
jgi:hypothetical protein